MIPIHGNQARRTADGWELDKSRVVRHDGLEVLCAIENHPIEFARNDDSITRDDALTLYNKIKRAQKPVDAQRTLFAESWNNMSLAL